MKLPLVFEEFHYTFKDREGKQQSDTSSAYRAQVPGGWIVRPSSPGHPPWVFVPDPNHEWEV
ncbi:MAG: hypothetical protein QM820_63390 [Minicystis sp.]